MCENHYSIDNSDSCEDVYTYIQAITQEDYMNLLIDKPLIDLTDFGFLSYLGSEELVTALNIGNESFIYYPSGWDGGNALTKDQANNSIFYIDQVLTKLPCLFYEGVLDSAYGPRYAYQWMSLLSPPYNNITVKLILIEFKI
jgi:hypothetical protein